MIGSETFSWSPSCAAKQYTLRFGVRHLLSEEALQRRHAREGPVDDLGNCSAKSPLSSVTLPSAAQCSIRTVVAASTVTERSLCRKSPDVIDAT